MREAPQNEKDWDRFWLLVLGTVVLGFFCFFAAAGGGWLVERSVGSWPADAFIVATAALGVYSIGLLYRGRFRLALLGFVFFAIGALGNIPTL